MRAKLLIWAALLAGLFVATNAQKPGQGYASVDPEISPVTIEDGEGEALRPGFHITAQNGWMNDPNGMFEHNNVTHVFYQWNPAANVWGAPFWGHVISSDLVYWKRLPPALVPDVEYDYDGAFSGSAAISPDGTPMLLYTGVSRKKELGFFYQRQAAAVPTNASDPELVHWWKPPTNPLSFELPPGGTHAQFRDPITPYQQGGKYWTAVGGQVNCVGSAILYSSTDLRSWQLEGELANQISIRETDGSCPAPKTSSPGDSACDQMGDECRAWECPDFFELEDGVFVLKWSDQVNTRSTFAVDWYVTSTMEPDLEQAVVTNTSVAGIFADNSSSFTPKIIDHGAIYASKSWQAADGRRLWLGWVFETAAGCAQQCSTGTPFTQNLGWQGAQTIPRVITYDNASQTLLFNPVAEIASLRNQTLYNRRAYLESHNNASNALPLAEGASLVQSELLANFTVSSNGSFGIGAVMAFGNGTDAIIYINGTVTGNTVSQANVFIDRSNAGNYTNTTLEGGPIPLPADGIPASDLELHVLFDRSLFEIFALGGRGRIASRVYPGGMLAPNWQLSLFGGGNTSVAASLWALSSCWVTNISPGASASV